MGRTLRIAGFADAVADAFAIHERFGRGHGAAILDRRGRVLDLTVFARCSHTIDDALDWARCFVWNEPRAVRMVLFSAGAEGVDRLREDDLDVLRRARGVFSGDGVEVVDWILCDGDRVRSLAFSECTDAWAGTER